jgi:23S rRNA (pseudouridine1915-N3)-methyltransferase
MKLAVLASGRLREQYAKLAAGLYLKRIRKLAPFELVEVREPKGARPDETARSLLRRLKDGDRLVLLSEGGRERTTAELSRMIGRALSGGRGRLVFAVGGPYGVGGGLERRADERLALSRMTLPHELARVVLLEQIYRALTMLRGGAYHHA